MQRAAWQSHEHVPRLTYHRMSLRSGERLLFKDGKKETRDIVKTKRFERIIEHSRRRGKIFITIVDSRALEDA